MKSSTGSTNDWKTKLFAVLLLGLAIQLVFFKFLPDLGTSVLPSQGPSALADFKLFEDGFHTPGNVFYPRFLGTAIFLKLAHFIAGHVHSSDVRLHPLRLTAAILTPIYAVIGLVPLLILRTRYDWRTFTTLYSCYVLLGLYAYYPFDMPSIALLSIAAFLILEEQLVPALLVMLLTGLVRESALHIVWFAFAWAVCSRVTPLARRALWTAVFSIAFAAEYIAIRHFYPGGGGMLLDLHEIFFGRGLWSLTCIVTLAIVSILPIHYVATRGVRFGSDWRRNFFLLNCAATPAWIIFYRIMGGNISELRMLIPVLLPIFYGIATFHPTPSQTHSSPPPESQRGCNNTPGFESRCG
jgi:hypothetical protein